MRFLVLVVLLFAATAMAQLSLVPLPCNNSAVLTCPLAYGQTELVCPNAAGGCTPSSCCPALNFADTTVPPEVDAFVVDADNNPFAPLGITLSGAGTVLYDGGNRVLSLAAGQALTLIAPTNYPLCLLEVTTRALGNTTLRLLGPNKNVAIEALGPQAMYTTTDVQVCNAPELTLLNRGPNDMLVQLLGVCLQGAQYDADGVCNGGAGASTDGGVSDETITTTPVMALVPCVYCSHRAADGVTITTAWGVYNPNPQTVQIDGIEWSNFFTTPPYDRGQPSLFAPGRNCNLFNVTWTSQYGVKRLLEWTIVTPTLNHGLQNRTGYVSRVISSC